jgi:integrase
LLSDAKIRKSKPQEKPVKLADSGGLYLYAVPQGGRRWRFDYRFGSKRKTISFGIYPTISLKRAREMRHEAQRLLAEDLDPSEMRKKSQALSIEKAANSFENIAREWHFKFTPKWTEDHGKVILRRLESNIFPWIGSQPIVDIKASDLLRPLRHVESRGALESAHRIMQYCGQVFRFAIATQRAERDPSADIKGALQPAQTQHYATLTNPRAVAELMRAIDCYQGSFITSCGLRLSPYVFVRPGELRQAEWLELNLEKFEWRIPRSKMKAKEQHIVPLSRQAVAILHELHPLTGSGRYVFPSLRSPSRPMSNNTINAALRRIGYSKDEMTAHGFRSMASTLLNELGWHQDAIERQLAHAERNSVRSSYNFAEYLPERRKMMQAWADYLDDLKGGGQVVPIQRELG